MEGKEKGEREREGGQGETGRERERENRERERGVVRGKEKLPLREIDEKEGAHAGSARKIHFPWQTRKKVGGACLLRDRTDHYTYSSSHVCVFR